MKHIIILEGPDNTGKDLLKKNLIDKLGDTITYHFSSPPTTIPKIEKLKYQFNDWIKTWMNTKKSMEIGDVKYSIWNRSHLGEYVYGPKYRNIPHELVHKKILEFEQLYLNQFSYEFKFHVVILIPHPDTVIVNDDGLSYSVDRTDKIDEINTFKRLPEITTIKNTHVYEVCELSGEFKDPIFIRDQILDRLDI